MVANISFNEAIPRPHPPMGATCGAAKKDGGGGGWMAPYEASSPAIAKTHDFDRLALRSRAGRPRRPNHPPPGADELIGWACASSRGNTASACNTHVQESKAQ